MDRLPEACVSAILSKTSPKDVCRLSVVSSTFHSAAESELTWDKLLPSNHLSIASRSIVPLTLLTKKEILLGLSDPLFIDNGRKSFKLERSTGKVSYVLSARELSITWSNDPMYWSWKSMPESRFHEVVELTMIHWLEIKGNISTTDLSPHTRYCAYLIIKISNRAFGLDVMPSETSVTIENRPVSAELAYLQCPDGRKQAMESRIYCNRMEMLRKNVKEGEVIRVPNEREDGWMEIKLGEFFNCDYGVISEEIKIGLKEVKGYQLKGGLIVEGIEIRPT